jgi:hypothetical protein
METRKFNPYLGYGRPDTVGLDLSAFVISYASTDTLNGRVMGYEHSDSLLVLLPDGDTAQFVLGVSGIYSGGAPEIAGIPRLERLAYHLRAHDDTTLYISVRANDSIAMDTVPHQASFFLKEDTVPDVVKYYFVENMPVERKLLVDSTKHFNPVSIDSVDVHLFVLIRKERYPAEEDPYEYLTYEELLENFSGPGLYEFSADIVTYHRYLTKNFYDYAFLGMEGESMLRAGSYMPSDFHLWIDTARGPGFNPLKPSFYIVKEVDTIPSKFNISGYFLHVMDSTSLPDHDEYVVKTIGGDYEYNRLNFVKANRYSGNELLLASSVALRARDSVGFAGKNEDAINEYRFYLQKTDNSGEYYIVTEQGYGQNGKRGYLSVMDGTNNTRLYVGPRSDSYARPLTVSVASRVSNETVLPPKPEETSKKIAVIGGDGQVAVHNALGESVTVFNVLGQRIADKVISSDRETIPVSRGILIVKVGGSVTQKVVVK